MTDITLITGAGIGIGRATALAFARAGSHVVVTDVLEDAGKAVVAEITAAGGSAEFMALDVRSTEGADAVVAAVEARHGKIDTIVANAGIAHRVPLPQLTDAKWDHTFEIDLKGIFRVVRPALAGMKARRLLTVTCSPPLLTAVTRQSTTCPAASDSQLPPARCRARGMRPLIRPSAPAESMITSS